MSQLRILVQYDGDWEWDIHAKTHRYNGGKVKGILVPKKLSYKGLLERLYSLLMLDPNEIFIRMKFIYTASMSVPPVEIADDEDVKFFLAENADSKTRTPLAITVQKKDSQAKQHDAVEPITANRPHTTFVPAEGSCQSMNFVPGAQATQFEPHVPFTENEKQIPECNLETEVEFQHEYDDEQLTDNLDHGDLLDIGNTINTETSHLVPSYNPDEGVTSQDKLTDESMKHRENIEVKQLFSSKKDLQKTLGLIAIKRNFEFKVKKSTKYLLVVGCVDDNCEWRLRATTVRESTKFKVRKYHGVHSCSSETCDGSHRQASSWIIGHYIKSKLEENSRVYKPKDIIEDVQREYGVTLSYDKARRARKCALGIEGSPPTRQQKPRRPRKRKLTSAVEKHTVRKCGRCGSVGHNRQTCDEHILQQADTGTGNETPIGDYSCTCV